MLTFIVPSKSRFFLVICAFNEEKNILSVLDSAPNWISRIIVVNDGSLDRTSSLVRKSKSYREGKVSLVEHAENRGQGSARSSGVKFVHQLLKHENPSHLNEKKSRVRKPDFIFFIDGDGQMRTNDLLHMKHVFYRTGADFVKAERLNSSRIVSEMPRIRLFGNLILSLLTKIASGNWQMTDSQSGFFGLTVKASYELKWDKLPKRFGQINGITIEAAIHDWKVSNFNIEPLYGIGEKSKLVPHKVAIPIALILLIGYFRRIIFHRLIWNSHPLALFHILSWILGASAFCILPYLIWTRFNTGAFPILSTYTFLFLVTLATVSLFHAMQLDYQESARQVKENIQK